MATDLMIHPRGGLGTGGGGAGGGAPRRSGSNTSMGIFGTKNASSSVRSGTPGGGYNNRSSSHQQPPIQRCPDGWSPLKGSSSSSSSNLNSRPGSAGAGRMKGGSMSSSSSNFNINNSNSNSNSSTNNSNNGSSCIGTGNPVSKAPMNWHHRPATRSSSSVGLHVSNSGSPPVRPPLSSASPLQSTSSSSTSVLPPVTSMTRTATSAGAESPTMSLAKFGGGPASSSSSSNLGMGMGMMMGAVDSAPGKASVGHQGGQGALGSFGGAGVAVGGGAGGWSTSPSSSSHAAATAVGGGSPTRRSLTMSMTQTGSASREQEFTSFLTKFTEGNPNSSNTNNNSNNCNNSSNNNNNNVPGFGSPSNLGQATAGLAAHERRHLEAHWRRVFRSADSSSSGVLSAEQIKDTVDRFASPGFGIVSGNSCSSSSPNNNNNNNNSNNNNSTPPGLESLRKNLPSVLRNFGARGASGNINEEEFLAFALFAHSWMGQGAHQQQQQQLPHLQQQQQQQQQPPPPPPPPPLQQPSESSPKKDRSGGLTLSETLGKTAEFGRTFGEASSGVHRQSPSFGLGPGSALAPLKSDTASKDLFSEAQRWSIGMEGSSHERSGTSPTSSSMQQQASLTEVVTGGSSQSVSATASLRASSKLSNSNSNSNFNLPVAPPSPKNQPAPPPPPSQPTAAMPPTPTRGGSVPFLPLEGLRSRRSDPDQEPEEVQDTDAGKVMRPSSTAAIAPTLTNDSNHRHHHHHHKTAAFPPATPPPGTSPEADVTPPPPSVPPPSANDNFNDRGELNWSVQGTGINHLTQFRQSPGFSESVVQNSNNERPRTRTSQSGFDSPGSLHRRNSKTALGSKPKPGRQGSKGQPASYTAATTASKAANTDAAEFVPYEEQVPNRVDAGDSSPTRTPLSRSVVSRQAGLHPSLRSAAPSTIPSPPSFGLDDDDLQDAITAPSGETDMCESSLMSDHTAVGSSLGQRKTSLTSSTCSSVSAIRGTASTQQGAAVAAAADTSLAAAAAAAAAAASSDDLGEWGSFNEETGSGRGTDPSRRQAQPPWVKSTRPGSSSGSRAGSKESRRPPSGRSSCQASAQNTPRSTRSGISMASGGSKLSRPPSRSGSKSSLMSKGRRGSKRRATFDPDSFAEAQQEAMKSLVSCVSEGTALGKLAFDLFGPTRSRDGRACFSPDTINEALRGAIQKRASESAGEVTLMPEEVDAMVARRSTIETAKEDAGLIIDVAKQLEAKTKISTRDTFGQILYKHREDPSLQTDAHRAVANDLQWVVEPDQAQDVLEMVTTVFRELTRGKQGMMHSRHWMKAMELMLANPVLSSRCSRQDPTRLFHAEAMRSVRRRVEEAGDTAGGFTVDLNRFFALLVELAENMQVHPFMIFFAIGCHADVLKDRRRRHESEDSASLPPSRPRSRQNSIVEGQPGCPPPMPATGGFR